MRSGLLAAVLATASSLAAMAFAQAADMGRPYKAPLFAPAVVAPYSWSGFYVGGNLGYASATTKWTGGAGDFSVSPNGFVGGATIGYNVQTGEFVWGIEGDIDYANLRGSGTSAICATCTIKDTWLGTVRGRLGYAMGNWLPYITAGGAWGNVYLSAPGGSTTRTKGGYAAGAGLEYTWGGPWSAKLEYLYVNLGDATCSASDCLLPANASASFTANVIRTGVNYRF